MKRKSPLTYQESYSSSPRSQTDSKKAFTIGEQQKKI